MRGIMADEIQAQEQVEAIVHQTAEDLQKRLDPGACVIIMVGDSSGLKKWGYVWTFRGPALGLWGTIEYLSFKVKASLAGLLK
jgi:hypothetical protein